MPPHGAGSCRGCAPSRRTSGRSPTAVPTRSSARRSVGSGARSSTPRRSERHPGRSSALRPDPRRQAMPPRHSPTRGPRRRCEPAAEPDAGEGPPTREQGHRRVRSRRERAVAERCARTARQRGRGGMHGGYAARAGLARGVDGRTVRDPRDSAESSATRPGCGRDLPRFPKPRNLLLVRPTGKRRGRKALPPSSGEPPPI